MLSSLHWLLLRSPVVLPTLWVIPLLFRRRGVRPTGRAGSATRSASTGVRAPGHRTPATATTAGCSSRCRPGGASAGRRGPTLYDRENSSTGRGWYG